MSTTTTKAPPEHSWLTFALLVTVQASAVWAVHQAGWLSHPWVLTWVSLAALLLGAAFAQIPAPGLLLHTIAFFTGVATLGYAGALTLSTGNLYDRIFALLVRIYKWVEITSGGGIGTDDLLFLLVLSFLAWLIGYAGAWAAFRHQSAWLHIIGCGAALVVTVSYADQLGYYFFFFGPAALVLFAQVHTGRRLRTWRAAGISRSRRLWWTSLRHGAVAALGVVGASALAPGIVGSAEFTALWQNVESPWLATQSEFSRLFSPGQSGFSAGSSSYGSTLALQSGVNLSDQPVLEVRADEARRLRGVVYDRYTGQGWLMNDRATVDIPVNGEALQVASADMERRDLQQEVTILRTKGNLLFAASLPKSVSVPVLAELERLSPGQGGGDSAIYTDLGAIRSSAGTFRGQHYTVVSSVSNASAAELRQAGLAYPQQIWRRYTGLPRSVPSEVRRLARTLTADYDNAYDKALAIETYLRGLTYSLEPPSVPVGRDVVDFFLFESKEGYCDYFSSAMVVMLRSLGIPARVVAGYLPGTYDETVQAYVVRESDSHSWPEVYFPDYGWIEFEPTASAPAIVHEATGLDNTDPAGTDPTAGGVADLPLYDDPSEMLDPFTPGAASLTSPSALPLDPKVFLGLLASVLAAAVIARLTTYLWVRRFLGLRPAEAAYAKMADVARWLGRGPRPYQTPFEYAETLVRSAPAAANPIRRIADAYVEYRFGSSGDNADDGRDLSSAWNSLRILLPTGLIRTTVRRLLRR
ncbi:MAG: DUF3488 and transglutaminase-like domain-containing protein [Dehalococcoidales bacterium]|nr:DUF3488 and transglutaminase-like domain-containing protein [Dehalococcoidales bacterium]